jgi:hypothetical protein
MAPRYQGGGRDTAKKETGAVRAAPGHAERQQGGARNVDAQALG